MGKRTTVFLILFRLSNKRLCHDVINHPLERLVCVEVGNPASEIVKESGMQSHHRSPRNRHAFVVKSLQLVLAKLQVLNDVEEVTICQVHCKWVTCNLEPYRLHLRNQCRCQFAVGDCLIQEIPCQKRMARHWHWWCGWFRHELV